MTTDPAHSFGLSWAQDRVRAFHVKAGHPVADVPAPLPASRKEKRIAWMREEIDEFDDASSLVDQADAIIDLVYFAMGTLVELGVDGEDLFDIVHRANMRKITGTGVILREDGKVQKPLDWVTPEAQMAAAIVAANSRYPLIVATEGDTRSASLAIIADAVGNSEWDRERLSLDYVAHNMASGFGEPFFSERASGAEWVPFSDDYVPWSLVSEAEFQDLLEASLGTFPGVVVGFQMAETYRSKNPTNRYGVVARIVGNRVLLIDPGPEGAGMRAVHVDDLYAGLKAASDGVHRIGVQNRL